MDRLAARLASLALGATLALALGAPASAGGWAITTFDQLPPEFVAGQTYHLGYTIRQHGVTPIKVDRTEIIALPVSGGAPLSFIGLPEGAIGHYSAAVAFPSGAYTWRVTQQPFLAQELGSLAVGSAIVLAAAPAAGPATPATPASPRQPGQPGQPGQPQQLLVLALAAATLGSALLFAARLAQHARRRGAIGAS